ncbi:MAG TPA: hypothetical protein VGX16_08010 [Solirubrobacteraceae bacterium]|nr:hypothetical protein [Solirubrobacteraceae bacterium]
MSPVAVGHVRRGGAAALGTALAVALATALGACGELTSADLFLLQRSGSAPGARLTLLVNEGGVVHCNGGPPLAISDELLVQARGIQEDLRSAASAHLSLPARAGSVLSYYLRDPDGTVRFADNSAKQPHVLRELADFTLRVAQGVCRLPM